MENFMSTVSRPSVCKNSAVYAHYTPLETEELRRALAKIDSIFEATFSEIIAKNPAYHCSYLAPLPYSGPTFTTPREYAKFVSDAKECEIDDFADAEESAPEEHYGTDTDDVELEGVFAPLSLQREDPTQLVRTVSVRLPPSVIQSMCNSPPGRSAFPRNQLQDSPATPELHHQSYFSSSMPPIRDFLPGKMPRLPERKVPPPIVKRRVFIKVRRDDPQALRHVNQTSFTTPSKETEVRTQSVAFSSPNITKKKTKKGS